MTTKDYLSFESKAVSGYEGTIIDVEREDEETIRVRFETDDYECAMYVTRDSGIWERNCYDTDLETWAADGPFQDYSDEGIYDFIDEAVERSEQR